MDLWLSNMERREYEDEHKDSPQSPQTNKRNNEENYPKEISHGHDIFGNFRKNYSDEEMKLWLSAADNIGVDFKNLLRVRRRVLVSDKGLEFNLFFSPKRESRPNQLEEKAKDSCCNMGKEISRWKRKRDNMLDEREYGDYLVCPNLYPICTGHVVLIQEDHNKKFVGADDLDDILRLGITRGYGVWHNMEKAASTMPHDHFQAVPINFPIEKLILESYDSDVASIKNYPGDNKVFVGERKISNTEAQLRRLDRVGIPYTLVISSNSIYVIPIRIPQYKGGIGGFETALNFVTKSWYKYNNLTGNDLQNRLKEVLFEPGVPAMVCRLS